MTRARDRLGRPVPAGSPAAVPGVPERASIDAEAAWREALAFLDDDLPFHAHEVLEQRWRCAPEPERRAWQGLAQWGAALTHRARGNGIGAVRVALRARQSLAEAAVPPNVVPEVVDLARVEASLAALSDHAP